MSLLPDSVDLHDELLRRLTLSTDDATDAIERACQFIRDLVGVRLHVDAHVDVRHSRSLARVARCLLDLLVDVDEYLSCLLGVAAQLAVIDAYAVVALAVFAVHSFCLC